MTPQPHKLPLTPHVTFFRPAGAAIMDDALVACIAALTKELREARERIADLEAEVLDARARGPFIPVTLGCL